MPSRVPCVVPFCRRTTGRPCGEWICPDHWRPVSRASKHRLSMSRRRRNWLAFDIRWEFVKRQAIEIAAGIRKPH